MSKQSLGSVSIKVDTAALRRQATELSARRKAMESRIAQLDTVVRRTRSYWIGDAGDEYRALYESEKRDVDAMLQRMKVYPQELLEVSGAYDRMEETLTDSGRTLGAVIR